MLIKSYRYCTITPQALGLLIQFLFGAKVLIKDAKSFEDCQNWIDRQLAHLAVEKALEDK